MNRKEKFFDYYLANFSITILPNWTFNKGFEVVLYRDVYKQTFNSLLHKICTIKYPESESYRGTFKNFINTGKFYYFNSFDLGICFRKVMKCIRKEYYNDIKNNKVMIYKGKEIIEKHIDYAKENGDSDDVDYLNYIIKEKEL